MASEHHIDAFDAPSFFALHDLNSDGFLGPDEIEAIYGVHHPYSKAKSSDKEQHSAKAKTIVDAVLKIMDTNGDGHVSLEEFEIAGLEALPDFTSLGAEGHHYDVESEFYLHHEEVYHSTPETQTDESYNHPEDIAHFENHEKIELEEENKERRFQGLPEIDKLPDDHDSPQAVQERTPLEEAQEAAARAAADPNHITPMDGKGNIVPDPLDLPNPRYTRVPNRAADSADLRQAARDMASKDPGYGEGPDGYKRPKNSNEKLRRNLPYKYKFRRSWGDF
ncbi:hypothetical protein FRC03_008984 [Tulasnella sp. 419]|nr:hypothetical protein FRC03_008984 [Tulasnella sp. 419]